MLNVFIHDALTRFLAQAVAVIVVSRLLGLVAKSIRQPMVIAEIVAGILLGPSFVGALFPEASKVLFAPESLGLLQVVSQVGLILFMFLVGLELDPKTLHGRGHSSVIISHTSIIVPFVLGALLAIYLYPRYSDPAVSFTSFTLFLGAAMSITAFPVLARILSERRLLRTHIGAVTITCAAVDDVTAWCILAFVVAIARSTGIAGALKTTALALAYIAVMWVCVRPLLKRLVARVGSEAAMSQSVVALVLVLVFLSGWTTEIIGIHALFGAFFFGAIMNKEGRFAHSLAEKIEDLVLVVFLPLFFAYSGLRTQIGLLNHADDWLMCAAIIVVACVGKFGGSAIPARLTGLSWREAGALGILMNTRGLMELIVLNIGLDLGVISPTIFTMMVLMALVTTFMTTPILKWVYPDELMARHLIDGAEPVRQEALPSFRVLVCSAYEASGASLISLAHFLTKKDKQPIHALHLKNPSDRESELIDQDENPGKNVLDTMVGRGKELNTEVRGTSFVSSDPAHDICRVAAIREAQLILLGVHKPLVNQSHLGGVVHAVMAEARTDVGVLVDRGLKDIQTLLVPFQGSAHDLAALRLARRLMTNLNAKVVVFHVARPEKLGAQHSVQSVFGEGGHSVSFEAVDHADPAQAVLERSRRGIDLVVVGLGQEWGLTERRFGVQPEKLIQESPTSLLVVRAAHASPDAALQTEAKKEGAAAPPVSQPESKPEKGRETSVSGRSTQS